MLFAEFAIEFLGKKLILTNIEL